MKVLHEDSYEYVGVEGEWHKFKCIKDNFDPEMLLLYRARMILKDGTSRFFDPIVSNNKRILGRIS